MSAVVVAAAGGGVEVLETSSEGAPGLLAAAPALMDPLRSAVVGAAPA
jgi:hypothetical protein